jgi:hypothetical protein
MGQTQTAPIVPRTRITTFHSDTAPVGSWNATETCKMNIADHVRNPHVVAAFKDMVIRGAAEFVLSDDGALLMIIRSETTEEVLFKVTWTGLHCLARLKI